MSLKYHRDDHSARIVLKAEGPVSVCDWADCLSEQMFENAWHYTTLYDFTGPGADCPEPAEFEHISATVMKLQREVGPRGPVAFAAPDVRVYAKLRRWIDAVGARVPYRIEVFRSLEDAQRWLDACVHARTA